MKARYLTLCAAAVALFWAGRASAQDPAAEGLQRFVGTFDVDGLFWFQPGQPPAKTRAAAEFKPVMKGRFVRQDYTDKNFGVTGIGYLGHDPRTGQWQSVWMYNQGRGIEYSAGKADKQGLLTLEGPAGGKAQRMYSHQWTDADTRVMKSWWQTPDGKTSQVYELTYKRRK
ncbi:MAG: DUF1579 family protein [Planctomycetota bacterium]|jgi:hypothetical protein